jgi:hypothetical protein
VRTFILRIQVFWLIMLSGRVDVLEEHSTLVYKN